ncbi:MAG TPA: hypothetical protein VFM93_02105 [Candidatus Limnocylindria bacterium]|nr:hypothetical protein [Candidatus Limnocylindria bacterium]
MNKRWPLSAEQTILVGGLIVGALVLGIVPLKEVDVPVARTACPEGRRILEIHGTMSTGVFHPASAVVKGLNWRRPDPAVFDAELNRELSHLIDDDAQCVLTFSFDDHYLARQGSPVRGVNAWNRITSPWDQQPERLADFLQRLLDDHQEHTFDIVAYSAGGIVPTYWAARERTTDRQRAQVNSLTVVDGVVSGPDLGIFDWGCANLPRSLRRWGDLGTLPCQFRYGGRYTTTVRTTDWYTKVAFATVRAEGDLIVWYDVAGLPGKAVLDPDIRARACAPWELPVYGAVQCVFRSHGSVLRDDIAARTIAEMMLSGPRR